MRAYVQERFAGPAGLTLVDGADHRPGPCEVLVGLRAMSLNYRDLMVAQGTYVALTGQPPFVPLSDGAGEVLAIGAGVSRFRPGDRVAANVFQGWIDGPPTEAMHPTTLGAGGPGMLAEQVVLHENGLVRIPDHLSFVEAACLPCAGVVAWNAVRTQLAVVAGENVLVQGSGGVALFAMMFAQSAGAQVFAISGSDDKCRRLEDLGAGGTCNYRKTPDWPARILELTDGRGIDLVVDTGGAQTLEMSFATLRPGGRISQVGVLTGLSDISSRLFRIHQATMRGISIGSRAMFEDMNREIAARVLRPVVDSVFAFEDAPAAWDRLASGNHFGKVCIAL